MRDIKQIIAILIKNSILQKRQFKTNLFQLLLPLIILFLIYILKISFDSIYTAIDNDDDFVREKIAIPSLSINELMYVLNRTDLPDTILYQGKEVMFGYGIDMDEMDEMDVELYNEIEREDLNDSYVFRYLGAYQLDEDYEYLIQYEADSLKKEKLEPQSYGETMDFERTKFCQMIMYMYHTDSCENMFVNYLMDSIHSDFIRNNTDNEVNVNSRITGIPFRLEKTIPDFDLNWNPFFGMFYSIILFFPLPLIIYTLVMEKEKTITEMNKLMGMKKRNYIFANYLFFFVILLFLNVIFVIGAIAFQHRIIVQTNPWIIVLLLIGSDLSVISLGFFFSSFFDKQVAVILAYIFIILFPFSAVMIIRYTPDRIFFNTLPAYLINGFPMLNILLRLIGNCLHYHCPATFYPFMGDSRIYSVYIFLFVDAIIYFVAGLYIEEIMPKSWGKRKSPWFFLDFILKYFRKEKVFDIVENAEVDDEDVKELISKIKSGEINEKNQAVLIKGLVKRFGPKVVVQNLFLNVEHKTCLAMLGPNGAGKTTSVNMLTGILSQTSGDAFINGHSINKIENIYDLVGLCPQFNILWEDLTARETLRYYTRMKGVKLSEQVDHVNEILDFIGLNTKKDQNVNIFKKIWGFFFNSEQVVHEMSAGMRRRLAIGISLVNTPELLIFDEPTTGLDLENMRKIWDLLALQKKKSSILLTTHKMEECEVLGDKIAIVNRGRLICLGENLHLKEKYGSGYNLWVRLSDKEKAFDIIDSFDDVLEKVLIRSFGNIAIFNINKKKGVEFSLSNLFKTIEEKKLENGIADFEISSTSLESVFSNAIKKDQQRLLDKKVDPTPSLDLIKKKKAVEEAEKEDYSAEDGIIKKPFIEKLKLFFSENFFQFIFLLKKNWFVNINSNFKNIVIFGSIIGWNIFSIIMMELIFSFYGDNYFVHPTAQVMDKNLPDCVAFGGIDKCYIFSFAHNNDLFAQEVLDEIADDYDYVEGRDYNVFAYEEDMMEWMLENENTTTIGVAFSNVTNFDPLTNMTTINYDLYFNGTTENTVFNRDTDLMNPVPAMKVLLDNTIYYLKQKERGINDVTKDNFDVKLKRFPLIFPSEMQEFKGGIQTAVISRVLPVVLLTVFVMWVYDLSIEREGKHKYYLQLIGVRKIAYFSSFFIQFVVYSIITIVVYYLCGIILQFDIFLYTDFFVIFLLFFTYLLSLMAMAFLIVSIVDRVRFALIIGFLILGVTFIVSVGLADDTIQLLYSSDINRAVPLFFEIFHPSYNLMKAISDIIRVTAPVFDNDKKVWSNKEHFGLNDLFKDVKSYSYLEARFDIKNEPVYFSIIMLFVNFLLYFGLFLIFEIIDFNQLYKMIVFKFMGENDKKLIKNFDDSDVQKEYEELHDESKTYLLKITDLQKFFFKNFYNKRIKAIDSFNLCAEKGSLIAIVGHNCAGKTTLTRLIQGELSPDNGRILFKNRSIYNDLKDFRTKIGVCNDYDIFWPQLTASQTFTMFAEIKGVPRKAIPEEMHRILKYVNLYQSRNVKVKNFSGGMKRRMMFALSLINDPEILILDEVTNGLDPDSTTECWNVINEFKKDRCVIITTNSMSEADNLADKIYIISQGKVKVKGSSLHLKQKFGVGYNLKCISTEGKEQELNDFVKDHIPHSKLIAKNAGNFVFNIKNEYLKELIEGMKDIEELSKEEDPDKLLIKNIGISFTTLEEVYFRIIPKENEKDKEEKSFSLKKEDLQRGKEEELTEFKIIKKDDDDKEYF